MDRNPLTLVHHLVDTGIIGRLALRRLYGHGLIRLVRQGGPGQGNYNAWHVPTVDELPCHRHQQRAATKPTEASRITDWPDSLFGITDASGGRR